MIDVVPLGPDQWLARCECGETRRFTDAPAGWAWILAHPCGDGDVPDVVDLTERQPCRHE